MRNNKLLKLIKNRIKINVKQKQKYSFIVLLILMSLLFISQFFTVPNIVLAQNIQSNPISYDFYDNKLLYKDYNDNHNEYNIDKNIIGYSNDYIGDSINDNFTSYNSSTSGIDYHKYYVEGIYPASYSFTYDDIDSTPSSFDSIQYYPPTCTVKVKEYESGHSKVVQLNQSGTGSTALYYKNLVSISGNISFWIRPTYYKDSYLELRNPSDTNYFELYFKANHNLYYNTNNLITTWSTNTWYHFVIEYNHNSQKAFVYINKIKYGGGSGYDYGGSAQTDLTWFTFTLGTSYPNIVYIDAFDLSSDLTYYPYRNYDSITSDYVKADYLESYNNHNNVLHFNDSSDSEYDEISMNVDDKTSGAFSFWLNSENKGTVGTIYYPPTEIINYIPKYDFTNDTIGSEPNGFVITKSTGNTANVISSFQSRDMVLNLHRTTTGNLLAVNSFSARKNCTLDFYMAQSKNTATSRTYFELLDSSNYGVLLSLYGDGYIKYYDGTWNQIQTYSANTWYFFKIYAHPDASSYHLWINSVDKGNFSYYNNPTDFSKIRLNSFDASDTLDGYFDTINYYWDKIENITYIDNNDYGDESTYGKTMIKLFDNLNNEVLRVLINTGGNCYYYYDNQYYNFFYSYSQMLWNNIYIYFDNSRNRFDFYLNYKLIGEDLKYISDDSFNSITILNISSTMSGKCDTYLNAFDFSWSEGYYSQRNFIPVTINYDTYQTNSFEFDYENSEFIANNTRFTPYGIDNDNIYIDKTNDINSGILIETNGNISSPIHNSGLLWNVSSQQKWYVFESDFSVFSFNNSGLFLYKFKFNCSNSYSLDVIISNSTNDDCYLMINESIYSEIPQLPILTNIGKIELNIPYNLKMILNLQNNYYDIYLTGNNNIVYYRSYFREGSNFLNSLYGIECIELVGVNYQDSNNSISMYIDSISLKGKDGFLIDQNFTTDEYSMFYDLVGNWDTSIYNLLTVDLDFPNEIVLYSQLSLSTPIYISLYPSELDEHTYNLWRDINNVYNESIIGVKAFGNFTKPNLLKIHGVALLYNEILSIPSYDYYKSSKGNYYYVDSINELKWKFKRTYYGASTQDEYMKIIFDVKDYYVLNDEFRFQSRITHNYNATISIIDKKSSSYQEFEVQNTLQKQTTVLQDINDTSINRITISIDCFSDGYAFGYSSGKIKDLDIFPIGSGYSFDDYNSLGLSFTEGLIYVAIRLIMFLIPCFVGFFILGNKAIIPIWLLMLVVYLVIGFIPFWMVVIQFIALFGMIIIPKPIEVS